jgi:uncharacterized protein (TIGR03000 family)
VIVTPPAGGQPKMDKADKGDKSIEGGKEEVLAPATVVLKAPADVTVTVNGQVTARRSTEETFVTPALASGREYMYLVTAEANRDGKKVSQTKRITVRAGERTTVEFGELKAAPAVARVTIVLPEKARLYVNGTAISATKGAQTFETPTLEVGRSYFYTIKADVVRDGRTVSETRRVEVAAGKDVKVDFTPAAVLTARR